MNDRPKLLLLKLYRNPPITLPAFYEKKSHLPTMTKLFLSVTKIMKRLILTGLLISQDRISLCIDTQK